MKKSKPFLSKKIKIVLSDVDGVLTDGGMYYSNKGESLKKFNTKDGMGVELLLEKNIKTILITRENSTITKKRSTKIKIKKLYQGIKNKEKILSLICLENNVKFIEIAYIGDDVNDIDIMKKVGLSCCPADAIPNVKKISTLISSKNGGDGCFREFADYIIKNFS